MFDWMLKLSQFITTAKKNADDAKDKKIEIINGYVDKIAEE